MTEINYTHIVLDAIYEHSKFSSNFIKRECLKANEKHINNEEFYSSLLDAVKFFENKINDIYASNLDRYFIGLNEDDLLPKENKTYYPKPELDKIGIPLFSYSNKYLGLTLYIEYLNNIKSIIGELNIDKYDNQIIEKGVKDISSIVRQIIEPYKEKFFNTNEDFNDSIQIISSYLEGNYKRISKPIFIKNNNIKNLASILGEIWRNTKNGNITFEYLSFGKDSFSILKSQKINKKDIFSSNFYKYTHIRPQ
jgi:hypothetical protein